jgi:hypothetical protein
MGCALMDCLMARNRTKDQCQNENLPQRSPRGSKSSDATLKMYEPTLKMYHVSVRPTADRLMGRFATIARRRRETFGDMTAP